MFNGNYKIVKERDNNDEFHYINNGSKINKNILPIPNKIRFIKKDNKYIMDQKEENDIYRRKHSGIIKRADNYQFYISSSGRKQPKFTLNTEQNGNKSFSQKKNLLKRDNIKLFPNNYLDKNKIKNNNINIYKNNKYLKISDFQQSPKSKGYQINNKKYSLPKKNINKKEHNYNYNIINASDINNNNFEGNTSYNNFRINMSNKGKIYRSPPSYSSNKFLRKIMSPLKRNISKEIEFNENIIKIYKINKMSLNQMNVSNHYPDNYKYHEIIHYNSPKKTLKTIDDNENDQNSQYINKNIYIINNNNNKISPHFLRNSHSPYITPLNQVSEPSKPIIVNEYLNDNYLSFSTKKNEVNGKQKNIIYDYNSQRTGNYMENPNTIHHFGEQMLKKNKYYNIQNSSNLTSQNEEINQEIKIPLKKDKSYNNIIIKNYNENKSIKSLPCDTSYKEDKNIIINNNINKDSVSLNVNMKRSRLNHNIINRKKIQKPEKKKDEDFIPKFKEKNIKNELGDKNNFCENIFDDKSIKDIIEEFEKEIEIEESERKRKNVLNDKQSDNLFISSISDFDVGDKSQNLNKSKVKKKHYYKTKNIDMEKNYDFMIYPTKKDKSPKK